MMIFSNHFLKATEKGLCAHARNVRKNRPIPKFGKPLYTRPAWFIPEFVVGDLVFRQAQQKVRGDAPHFYRSVLRSVI